MTIIVMYQLTNGDIASMTPQSICCDAYMQLKEEGVLLLHKIWTPSG